MTTEGHFALVTFQVVLAQCSHAAFCVPAHGSREMGEIRENNVRGPSWKHQVLFCHSLTWHEIHAISRCTAVSPCFHPLEPGRL